MKQLLIPFVAAGSMMVILGVLAGATARSQVKALENNYADLATRVVNTSAGVKPGDVVIVAGGKHNVPVMEELAIQAAKAGGLVQMFLYSDRFARALWTEVPEKYLGQQTHLVQAYVVLKGEPMTMLASQRGRKGEFPLS